MENGRLISDGDNTYRKALPVLTVHWPYVTNRGIGLKGLAMVKESGFATLSTKVLRHFHRHSLSKLLTERKRVIKKDNILSVHHPWSNGYHHWLSEVLAKLVMSNIDTSAHALIIPEDYPAFAFESLEAFVFSEIIPLKRGTGYFGRHVSFIGNPNSGNFSPDGMRALRKLLLMHSNKKGISLNLGEKIHVSRKRSGMRRASNEKQVVEVMEKHGFKTIEAEEYGFWEQVSIFSNCKAVAGVHGAGLTNMIFMPEGGRVIEFQGNHFSNLCYANLALACGLSYSSLPCKIDPSSKIADINRRDVIVDPVQLSILAEKK